MGTSEASRRVLDVYPSEERHEWEQHEQSEKFASTVPVNLYVVSREGQRIRRKHGTAGESQGVRQRGLLSRRMLRRTYSSRLHRATVTVTDQKL